MRRSIWHFLRWVALTAALITVVGNDAYQSITGPRPGISLPGVPRIVAVTVIEGLNDPAGFTFDPSGTIYFLERGTGWVRTLDVATKTLTDVLQISGVDGSGERGALGIALSPDWPTSPYLYAYVTRRSFPSAPVENQLVRIRVGDGRGVELRVLFTQPVSSATNHNGGRIMFGPDGKLYVVIGENADPANAQDLSNLRGKILRVNADGTDADGTGAVGNLRDRIWAFGIRNSFGFTFDPDGGGLWETENGPECNDEINLITAGGNYGWGPSEACGVMAAASDTNNSGPAPVQPKTVFRMTIAITGAAFCHNCGLGAESEGRLFFGCVNDQALRGVGLNTGRTDISGGVAEILTAPGGIYSMETAPDGTIYFSNAGGIYRLELK